MTIIEQVLAAQAGDDEVFYELVSSQKHKLYAIAYAYLKNESDALDAIQEATCRAYAKLRKLKEPGYFHTWLIRILIHHCIDEQKRRSRALPLYLIPESLVAELNLEDRIVLRIAIDRLPPNYRHIIILKYDQDMTLTEIAKLLEKPEGTVKTWLNKALKELRVSFGREGGYDHA
ncbi:sigma-70 family RNA polymerase sigma factor [Cohnella nanjingensis]|uniref:Sigma-70 family RNA polymerase sigma factor n=1 Tax=Cohnella nanjingensis TaxID=1387779 RepID=A0A7X0VJ59_9BACL|nr:sigma-70 family RNA polymerase sigma factor [Cohnella nanjingensis]MBB6675656.1 sigma-70 family RNA polymerase sigma factor [Cohnella nanjingensis]